MTNVTISIAITRLQELPDAAVSCLSQVELERAGGLKVLRRRQQYLCARALLRTLLQHHTGEAAASHALSTTATGKPICVGGPAISIAHSGDLIICAVTNEDEIGVDIEQTRPRKDLRAIASRHFAPDEARWLANQPEDHFYMLWVLKEAWLKARGTGIAGGLNRLRCVIVPPDIDAHVPTGKSPLLSLYALDDMLVGLSTSSISHESLVFYCWHPLSGQFDQSSDFTFIAATGRA